MAEVLLTGASTEVLFTRSVFFHQLSERAGTLMSHRVRLVSYVALTVLAFATVGRAPRLLTARARDLPPTASTMTPGGEGEE